MDSQIKLFSIGMRPLHIFETELREVSLLGVGLVITRYMGQLISHSKPVA